MKTKIKDTIHPHSGEMDEAIWHIDYYENGIHGVEFPDGTWVRSDTIDEGLEED